MKRIAWFVGIIVMGAMLACTEVQAQCGSGGCGPRAARGGRLARLREARPVRSALRRVARGGCSSCG